MNRTARSLIALASATALTASVAVAAQAEPIDAADRILECVDGTEWELIVNGYYFDAFAIDEAAVYGDAACEGYKLVNDAFDGLWAIWLAVGEDGIYYGQDGGDDGEYIVDRTVAENGDIVFTGPVESIFGLDVQVEIRIYAAGDMVRVFASYTNPTAAPITVATGTDSGYGSDETIEFIATSSGDAAPTTVADNWAVTSDGDESDPVLFNAWQSADGAWRATELELYADHAVIDNMWTSGDLTVAPGATVHLAYFTKIYGYVPPEEPLEPQDELAASETTPEIAAAVIADDIAAAEAAAIAGTSEWTSFTGRLTAGLANGTVVLNWGTVGGARPADPATPVTGSPAFTG